jgi:hypothetical protein
VKDAAACCCCCRCRRCRCCCCRCCRLLLLLLTPPDPPTQMIVEGSLAPDEPHYPAAAPPTASAAEAEWEPGAAPMRWACSSPARMLTHAAPNPSRDLERACRSNAATGCWPRSRANFSIL